MIWTVAQAQTSPEDVKEFTLANGMQLLVVEDHSIPNANMYLFWRVGSRNEAPGITGLSHFFEHMMFNGAEKYGPKEFDVVMEAAGGSNNAYTSEDVTVYTDWFPASSLEVIFDLEADRIGHLAIDDQMVESERGVVLSERSTGLENSNYNKLNAQVKSAAMFAHPYSWPVIGYESDIKAWTKADLQNYFDVYYAPNNCTVIVVGDVETDAVLRLAQQYFEPIPAHDPPQPVRTVEPPQQGERRVVVYKEVSSPNLEIAYHVPNARHPDYYALELLSSILSTGNSSRLQKALIFEQSLATQLYTFAPISLDPNLFEVFLIAAPGVAAADLEAAFYVELDRIKTDGVTEKELQKVKNQKLMEFYRDVETINGKANNLGRYEVFFGDFRELFQAPERFEKVTAADIKRVANTYFSPKNRTVGTLIPEPKP